MSPEDQKRLRDEYKADYGTDYPDITHSDRAADASCLACGRRLQDGHCLTCEAEFGPKEEGLSERIDVVATALSKACLDEFGTDWNYVVACKFAQAAIEAIELTDPPLNQQIRIEALRAAAEVHGRVTSAVLAAGIAAGRDVGSMTEDAAAKSVITLAKAFERYLESGE